ncbi:MULTISPECIES: MT-A70 family methyltransferase [unclassified Mesorhizobium]|uniref:MT-A70 family methyltransferase n=1 Tax=unclassified Mesorhizobium TaxID=325217 RepID=UPI0009EA9939|nr:MULTISPECIES: MT-A70 family methyltransferase [unclassified Mesorhizobium]
MTWPFGELRPLSFGAIIADPPWQYDMRSDKGYGKSPEVHYDTMPEAEIAALPVGHLAGRDCLLFLWSTWPHLPVAQRVMAAWGFSYKTGGSWTKRGSKGGLAFGTGYILRSTTEPFLVGTIGEPTVSSKSVRNHIDAKRREHSRKPLEAREMVEKLLPRAFAIELFAREPWAGQKVWGLEAAKFSGQQAELGGDFGSPLAEGAALLDRPVGMLAGQEVVDAKNLDGQLGLFGQEHAPSLVEGDAVDREIAYLRRDREGTEAVQNDLARFGVDRRVAGFTGIGRQGDKNQHKGENGAHDVQNSGREP